MSCNCEKDSVQYTWKHTIPDINETVGRKDDNEKLRYDLVPPHALAQITSVLTFGAKKYADDNWRKVPDPERRYVAAAMRHIEAYRAGETLDKETGVSHLAHAACCLMFLLEVK